MIWIFPISVTILLGILALAAYADRIYFEMGKFLSREYTENIDAWEELVEPRLHLSRESATTSASVLRQVVLGTLAFMFETRFPQHVTRYAADAPQFQQEYGDYGRDLKKHFDPTKP